MVGMVEMHTKGYWSMNGQGWSGEALMRALKITDNGCPRTRWLILDGPRKDLIGTLHCLERQKRFAILRKILQKLRGFIGRGSGWLIWRIPIHHIACVGHSLCWTSDSRT